MWRPDNPQSQPVGGKTKRFLELNLTSETQRPDDAEQAILAIEPFWPEPTFLQLQHSQVSSPDLQQRALAVRQRGDADAQRRIAPKPAVDRRAVI